MSEPKTLVKGGNVLTVIGGPFPGKIGDPNKKPNPCGHFTLTVVCTCKVHEHVCKGCGRIWADHTDGHYEIADPHKRTTKEPPQ